MIEIEIIEALKILESCGVSEDKRREIALKGINFKFSYDSHDAERDRYYNILEFANVLKTFKDMNVDIDVNAIINNPTEYEEIITIYDGVNTLKKKFNKNVQ